MMIAVLIYITKLDEMEVKNGVTDIKKEFSSHFDYNNSGSAKYLTVTNFMQIVRQPVCLW